MTPLARTIYAILRGRTGAADPRITYKELAAELRERDELFEHITQRSQALYAALCEVGEACRRLELPPLPALVVRADTRRPGDAYYEGMPQKYRGERIAAWRRDLEAVRAARYPRRPDVGHSNHLLTSPRNAKRWVESVQRARER